MPAIIVSPASRNLEWKEEEGRKLHDQKRNEAENRVAELSKRRDGEHKQEDYRVIESRVDPNPARPKRYPIIDLRGELDRLAEGAALDEKIELISADDQNDRHQQVDNMIKRRHSSS